MKWISEFSWSEWLIQVANQIFGNYRSAREEEKLQPIPIRVDEEKSSRN